MRTSDYKPADTFLTGNMYFCQGQTFSENDKDKIRKIDKRAMSCRNNFHTVQGQIQLNKKRRQVVCVSVENKNTNSQLKAFWDPESTLIAEDNEKTLIFRQ